MQDPRPGSDFSATPSASGGMYASSNENEGDLPSSLPSYVPPSSAAAPPPSAVLPFGLEMLGRVQLPLGGSKTSDLQSQFASATSISINPGSDGGMKRHAPAGQWKTPPQFMYASHPAGASASPAGSAPDRDGNQLSPSAYSERGSSHTYGDETPPPPPQLQEIGGISAAQFAASTGGLTMDATLLARVSGTDPALMGSEEIKQIMRCPDLLSIYQKLQEEDDRRQRRLERNRASARVRREKKKNMVETYEVDVSKLESSLNALKSHRFGTGQAQELDRALEYSGGEHLRHAMMSKEAKTELIGRILGQHTQSTKAIRAANRELLTLIGAASQDSEPFATLRTQLRLSDEQCRQLQSLAHGAQEEARKLDAIAKCFSALRAHDWLYFSGMETLLHQTRNAMTPQQFQKLLAWTSENSHPISQLQALPSGAVDGEKDLQFVFSED